MNDVLICLFLFFILACIILLAFILSYYERVNKVNSNQDNSTATITNTSCLTSLDVLPDASTLKCCYNVVFPSLRYDPSHNVVLSTSPNYYIDACSGFCPDGKVSYDTKTCADDPTNQQFLACIDRIAPTGCSGLSVPVAKIGTRYYFVVSATDALCPISQQYIC